MYVLLAAAIALIVTYADARWPAHSQRSRRASGVAYAAAFIVIVAFAGDRLIALDGPLQADSQTQRILISTLPPSDIVAHRYSDTRHPPLYYLVLHAVGWFSLDGRTMRLVSAVSSMVAMAGAYMVGRAWLGPFRGLVGPVAIGLNLTALHHARIVDDAMLFLALAMWSTWLLPRSLDQIPRAIAYALVTIAMLWTYYVAILVLTAQVAAAFTTDRAQWRRWVGLFGLIVVAWLPELVHLVALLSSDAEVRQVARAFPTLVWGDTARMTVMYETLRAVIAVPWVALAWLAFAAVGVWRWWAADDRAAAVFTLVAVSLATLAVWFGSTQVRVQPHYTLWLAPFFAIGAANITSRSAASPWSWTHALFVALWGATWAPLVSAYTAGFSRVIHPEVSFDYDTLAAHLDAHGGADILVADPHFAYTAMLYHFFDNPGALYQSCHVAPPFAMVCDDGSRRVITLSMTSRLHPGWEAEAVRQFRTIDAENIWYMHHSLLPNGALEAVVAAECDHAVTAKGLSLFHCSASPE